jgi:hypothetical protein
MEQVRRMIAECWQAIDMYDSQLPYAQDGWRRQLVAQRQLNLQIIVDLQRVLARA